MTLDLFEVRRLGLEEKLSLQLLCRAPIQRRNPSARLITGLGDLPDADGESGKR